METNQSAKIKQEYGKRVQRCYGCFIPYHLKDYVARRTRQLFLREL